MDSRNLIVSRKIASREVTLRMASDDRSEVDNLTDEEIDSVKLALASAGLRMFGKIENE